MELNLFFQRGVSLIEALIALLVLSIGLVGLGSLMMVSLKNVHSASYYSVASALALDFEERLWQRLTMATADADADDLDGDQCLKTDVIDAVAEGMITDWTTSSLGDGGWTDAARFVPPGLAMPDADLSIEPFEGGTVDNPLDFQQIDFAVTWTEGRFEDLESDIEKYTGRIVMICRPTYL